LKNESEITIAEKYYNIRRYTTIFIREAISKALINVIQYICIYISAFYQNVEICYQYISKFEIQIFICKQYKYIICNIRSYILKKI